MNDHRKTPQERERDKLLRTQEVCAEAYQAFGALADMAGIFATEDVEKVLDNLGAVANGEEPPHESFLPWPGDRTLRQLQNEDREEAWRQWHEMYQALEKHEKQLEELEGALMSLVENILCDDTTLSESETQGRKENPDDDERET